MQSGGSGTDHWFRLDRTGLETMDSLLGVAPILIAVGGWFALQRYILPRMGVNT